MSVKEHIIFVMEFFQEVAVIGDAVSEDDRVVHRLACHQMLMIC